MRTVEGATSERTGLVDSAATGGADVLAATVDERQDRSIIKQNASMAGATGSLAGNAWQVYHLRRANSAAI
ncbi:MAG: hypothetical protein KC983_11420, partial [Phycisphaerales bacterium]|nr:hypothetical protein [Phycisphaerales bacterium]